MVEQAKIARAVELLREAARPRRIIIFGSHARGDAGPDSDVDFLVIERSVPNILEEIVRLRQVLRPLRIPVDLLVASEDVFQYWSDTPGNVYSTAANEGRVVYEAP